MDLGAFVQENRKWLIGCGVGGLLFLIARIVIGSVYDDGPVNSQWNALRKSNSTEPVYNRAVLDAARTESEQLAAEKLRLQQELAFQPSAKYQLPASGSAANYLFSTGLTLKQGILTAGLDRDVDVAEKEVTWPVPPGVDEIRSVLFGLELIDECAQRLFAAHDAVRAKEPEAMGLRTILLLKTEARTGQRSSLRNTRPGEVDLRDHVVQERVAFKFQADAATITAFFEACRKAGRTLVLEVASMQQPPDKPGDPVTVNGTLVGIAFKEGK